MTAFEHVQSEVKRELAEAGLFSFVDWDQTQFLTLGDQLFVELVVLDAGRLWEATDAVSRAFRGAASNGDYFQVRAKWALKAVGEPQLATTSDGKFVAATVVPVTVISDRVQQHVNVSITTDAEAGFTKMLGLRPDPRDIAKAVVTNALRLGGASAWNPQQKPRLEVTAQMANDLSRQLARAA